MYVETLLCEVGLNKQYTNNIVMELENDKSSALTREV